MTRYFCSLFDSGYLIKGIAMFRSLKANCPDCHIFILCMDSQTMDIIQSFGHDYVTCIPLEAVETPEILEAKKTRGKGEYCWTLSPCLPWYIFEHYSHVDFITYLDADLLFFSSLDPLFDEIGVNSIAIIEHRFASRLKEQEINGRFCVEWVSFRRDEEGLACLSRWRDQCIEWCFYRLEPGRMGDQKYLDEWPALYATCHILQHVGAGLAPWNFEAHQFSSTGDNSILVDGKPLIFYHFHQFQMLDNGLYDRLSAFYTQIKREPDPVYQTYEDVLSSVLAEVRNLSPSFKAGLKPKANVKYRRLAQKYLPFALKEALRRFLRH